MTWTRRCPADDPLRALGHGHAGAQWLIERGYPELAPAVDSHPVDRLTEQPYDDWVRSTTLEQRIVAYADKRAQRRVVTLDAAVRPLEPEASRHGPPS